MGSLHIHAILLIIRCTFFISFKQFQPVYSHDIDVAVNSSVPGCITSERRALMQFKASLVDSANRLSSWTGADCCAWDGITCNDLTGHVEKLDLRNPIQPKPPNYFDPYSLNNNFNLTSNLNYTKNCLGGNINPSLQDLGHLFHLDLSCNNFWRIRIPKFLGSLRNLRYLNLSDAGFEGEVPPHLGNLSKLQHLDIGQSSFGLTHNSLSSKNIEWVAGFSSMKSLDLSGVNLSECVDWMDSVNMLPSLSSLTLRNCTLRSAGKLQSPLVPFHFNLTSLTSLDVGLNTLHYSSSLFTFFNHLADKLQVLKLGSNNFEGPIPFLLRKFRSLTVLDLSGNAFDSSILLNLLCNHTCLGFVDLSFNKLEGSLPVCLGNLTSLKVLNLRFNKFGGKIPSELGHLKQLTHLDLSDNSFNSSIPSSFGGLTELESLALVSNQWYGTIPEWIGELSQLRELALDLNNFHGMLPSSLKNVKNLASLSLSDNQFNGTIPEWIGEELSQLRELALDSNNFHGMLPSSLKNVKNLTFLYLSDNQFNGTIPEWIGEELSQLQNLKLGSNNFSGVIPSSMKKLGQLQLLNLSENHFTGSLTEWIGGELSALNELYLQSNNFSGNIPIQLCQLPNLSRLKLANNNFTGHIPDCFGL